MIKKRRRVTADQVRKAAKDGGGGSRKWFNLPEGTKVWYVEKAGRYNLDILPYEVTDENHPDGVDVGQMWYQTSFRVHFKEGISYVCPKSRNREAKCYDCAEFFRLKKEGASKEELKPFSGQMFNAYNIRSMDDPNLVDIFCMSSGKFWDCNQGTAGLKLEIDEAKASDLLFFSTEKGKGRTLRTRFSKKKFMGKDFLQCTGIEFKPRKSIGSEITDKVVDLDKALRILPTEKLKKVFMQSGEDEDERPKKKLKDKKKIAKRAKELAKKHPSPLKHQRDEDEEETKPAKKKLKKGKKLKKLKKKCPIKGGTFGEDCDKFKKCATCPLYKACEAASGE